MRSVLAGTSRALAALALGAGCGDAGGGVRAVPGVAQRFSLERAAPLFDRPVPSELGRETDGSYAWGGFPIPPDHPSAGLLARYVELADGATGAAPTGAIFLAFDGALDPATLPATARGSLEPDSPVQLVDVDPSSPERGRRIPVRVSYRDEAQTFGPAHLLAIWPEPGFVLGRDRLYAAVVTRSVLDATGAPLGSPLALEALKRGRRPAGELGARALELHAPVFDALEEAGVSRDEVAAVGVLRTMDAVGGMLRLARHYRERERLPALVGPLARAEIFEDYCVYEGRMDLPIFQDGRSPYVSSGGEIHFDPATGEPIEQRREAVRFLVTVPRRRMPAAGFPVLQYEHGGAGTFREVVERGTEPDPEPGSGPARGFARRGIAVLGKDAATNVNRGNVAGGLFFFNFTNPVALRDNVRQSALEQVAASALLRELRVDASGCPGVDATAADDGRVRFDPGNLYFMGHSTGSTVGPLVLAVEPGIRAGILSGSGISWMLQVLHKRQPFPLRPAIRLLLAPDEELDPFRPFLTLLQTGWEEAEPLVYEPHVLRDPLDGAAPRSIYASFGILDTYNPPPAENPAVAALGLDVAGPLVDAAVLDVLALSGGALLEAPVAGNVDGTATAVATQYLEDGVLDGHNVIFQLEEAKYQSVCFIASLVRDGVATLPPRLSDATLPCP